MRRVIYVPTLHSRGESNIYDIFNLVDPSYSGELEQKSDGIWDLIDCGLSRLDFNPKSIKLFSEGNTVSPPSYSELCQLPQSDFERLMGQVNQAAGTSRETKAVSDLWMRGASIEASEDQGLYESSIDTLNQIYGVLGVNSEVDLDEDIDPYTLSIVNALGIKLLDIQNRRDMAVAGNIDTRLLDGQIGVVFMGAAHKVPLYLKRDIVFDYLDSELWWLSLVEQKKVAFSLESMKSSVEAYNHGQGKEKLY